MKQIFALYLFVALIIAVTVTLLTWMGVLDAPLARVWRFFWIPFLAALALDFLEAAARWVDEKTHF